MKKAFLVELTVLTGYIKQLLPIAAIVGIFIAIGTGNTVALAGIFVSMFSMMGAMAASAYDDASNWGAYRLTFPLSRRDVVLGRYTAVTAMGVLGIAAGVLLQVLAAVVGGLGILPSDISSTLTLTEGDILASVFSIFCCLFMGMTAAAFAIPVYFKFGNTKATQFLPMMVMGGYCLIMIAMGNLSQHVDVGSVVAQVVTWIETPVGVAFCAFAFIALTVLVLSLSAAVSMGIYARRDL